MTQLRGRVVAITGAGSGIGRALAERLAREEGVAGLALCDEDGGALAETGERLVGTGAATSLHQVDVADRIAVERFALAAKADLGGVDVVVNDAGISIFEPLETISYEDLHRVMDVVFWGVVHGTRAFLPLLRERPRGHVVNVGSLHSILAAPQNGAYSAAKGAVKNFTDALDGELAGSSIRTTVVMPGGVRTDIFRRAPSDKTTNDQAPSKATIEAHARLSPTGSRGAARVICNAIRHDERRVMLGPDATALDLAHRLAPTATQWAFGRAAARAQRVR
jgi:NAD(P)-dependent dehydrogenase (short-subunit alcohol dehydrogenase family)